MPLGNDTIVDSTKEQNMRTANRWVIAIAGVFLQIALGDVNDWSVIRNP